MDRQQIGLGLALRDAGIKVDMSEFDRRLVLQKTVYLLQEAGVHLGYPYRWYLRGPYSPALADDLFMFASLEDHGASELANWQLEPASQNRIAELKPLLTKGNLAGRVRPLELLASTLFLVRTGQAKATDAEGITSTLHANGKTYYNVSDVTAAIQELRDNGFSVQPKWS